MLSHVLDYFGKVYIINLRERTDRRKATIKELKRHGISSDSNQVEFYLTERPTEQGEFPSIGVRGCFTGHTNVMRLALEQKLDRVLVMEDDIAILDAIKTHGLDIVQRLQTVDWDIVYFGYLRPQQPPQGSILVPYNERTQGGHFYGINGKILPRLVEFLEGCMTRPAGHPEGGPTFRDGGFNLFRKFNPDVKTYLALPNLAVQRSSRTNLHKLKWFDRLPITRPLIEQIRSLKNNLAPRK